MGAPDSTPLDVAERMATAAACGLEATGTCDSYRKLRQHGMPAGASFCTHARDRALAGTAISRMDRTILEVPTQGHYVACWREGALTLLRITRIVRVRAPGQPARALLLGSPLSVLEACVGHLICQEAPPGPARAVELTPACSLEQCAVRPHAGAEGTALVVCLQSTVLLPLE